MDNFAFVENRMTDIFAELGRRLAGFGGYGPTQQVARNAAAQNPWFQPSDVVRAVRSLAENMLTRGALEEWLSRYPALPAKTPRSVLLVMAGNIPLVGFQDLLCTFAAGHGALLKMSSKDSVLMSYIVGELRAIEPGLPIAAYDGSQSPDAVIAMGGDNAVRALRSRYAGLPVLLRGNRSSLAVVSGDETGNELDRLAEDILSYSGLGCRNVSLLFVPSTYDMEVLRNALRHWNGTVNQGYINNYRQTKALLTMSGADFTDCGFCLLREERGFPAAVSCINFTRYSSIAEATAWITEHAAEIQCVAGSVPVCGAVAFGRTQSPSLTDYPDGRDTMRFLSGL